eukprot:Em0001g748a
MRAGAYEEHECVLTLTASEERAAAALLKRAISTSSKGIIQLGTGGTPVTFMRITNPHNSTTAVCSRTLKSRCSELHTIRRVVSGGQPSVLIQNEVLSLGDEQRRALLKEAGISDEIKIGPAEVLAIKVGLAIPWNKIRILRRWLKASNISLACGEVFRGAPLVFIPDLILKVVELLEENDRLTWHNGVIPASEIWIKLGGDKGGGTFKMNFQIVNVAAPNSVNNTCVFCCFEADDSYTNLHIALEQYKEQVKHLQGMTWSLDLELAFYHTEVDQSRYSLYSQELQRLHQYKVELQEAKQSESVLQQLATYMAVLIGESNPLTADLLHQSANTSKIVKQLETKIAASTAIVTREFPLNEGPFVKELDMALQSIGVHRQQYFGGTFVGNHVHKTLKLPNINTLCSAICKLAESSLPQKSEMVATRTMIFLNAFSKFAKCHSIYDQNFIDEAQVHELEQSVQEFMELFRTNFPKGTIPIKMHMVEDHAVQWARSTHVGFGLLGEQGAESIHAKFNNLARAYSAIKGKKLENHFRKFVRLGLGKKEVALSMYLSVNVKLEPSQLPAATELFVQDAIIFSREGTTQGDPLAMPMYALGILPLIQRITGDIVWYADYASATGTIHNLREKITTIGPSYGYYANATKTWTVPNISTFFTPIEDIIMSNLIPSLTGRAPPGDLERLLLSLPPRIGGLGFTIPTNLSAIEFDASTTVTKPLYDLILQKKTHYPLSVIEAQIQAKKQLHQLKQQQTKDTVANLLPQLSEFFQRSMVLAQEKGASSWLTTLPISEHGFALHKEKSHKGCVRLLLSAPGIDANQVNHRGDTPLKLATSYEVLTLLQKYTTSCEDFPVHTYGKVIMCGDSGAGKSTLTEAIIHHCESTSEGGVDQKHLP